MKLELISYGLGSEFDDSKFSPVINDFVKPKGGLWASPINSTWGWKDWCKAENYGDLETYFEFEIDGKIMIVNSVRDLDKFEWIEYYSHLTAPDFEAMHYSGVQAIFLTENGQEETRFSLPRNLSGWDCESVFIMNQDCIKR